MRKLLLLFGALFLTSSIFAQTQVNGDRFFYGIMDASGATKTVPVRSVTTNPTTCDATTHESVFNSSTNQLEICTATNVWTAIQGSGGSSYVLPAATPTVLGGVKQGSGVNISADGTLSVTPYSLPIATGSVLGGVKAGSNVTIAGDGKISVAAPYTLIPATSSALGGVKQGTGVSIAGDGTLSVSLSNLGVVPLSQIPTGIDAIKIGNGDVDNTHLSRVQAIPTTNAAGSLQNDGAGVLSWAPSKTSMATATVTNRTTALGTSYIGSGALSAGMYRMCAYTKVTTAGSAGTMQVTFGWNDGTAQTLTPSSLSSLPLTTQNAYGQGCSTFYSTGGTNSISYSSAFTGATGSPAYSLFVGLDRLF